RTPVTPVGLASMKAKRVTAAHFRVAPDPARNATPVIGVVPGRIITEREQATLPVNEAGVQPDLAADVIKVAVIERHGRNGNIGRAFVKGFGLQRGAIASSVGHDRHNITVVGASGADLPAAVNRLIAISRRFARDEPDEMSRELDMPL